MAKGILKQIKAAESAVLSEMQDSTRSGDRYSRGLSSEGYAGGYFQALQDVKLAISGVPANSRYWPKDTGVTQ